MLQEKEVDVICMGRVAVDLYAEESHMPLRDVEAFKKYLGGSPGNISVGSRRLGLKSALFSCIGKDEMGFFLKEILKKEGVDTSLLYETDKHLTALAILGINPPSHFPLMFYRENCADMQLHPSQSRHELFRQAKLFQFSGTGISTPSMREATREAIKQAKENGVLVVFDLDFRPVLWELTSPADGETRYIQSDVVSKHYQSFLPFCDLVVGTDEEIMTAGGINNVDESLLAIKALTDADIVYKKGLQGSEIHLHFDGDVIMQKAYEVEVYNTLGAGDGFMSGLLYGILKKASWLDTLSYANACGAIVSSRHGCAPAMPTEEELHYFLEKYPEKGKEIVFDPFLKRGDLSTRRSPHIKCSTPFPDGKTDIVRKDDSYQSGMNFSILKLRKGEQYTLTSPLESAYLLMTGQVVFHYANLKREVKRQSYFKSAPFALHLAAYSKGHVEAISDTELLVLQTENEAQFEPILFDENNMLENEHRGKGLLDDTSYRIVRTIFDKRNRPESNLVLGEIITFGGRWSSTPPHTHIQPEIYHYRFSEPKGFAFAEDGEDALKVNHFDTLVIQNEKQHAHCAAPGYALYTMWCIKHLENRPYITPEFDKAHDWARFESANKRAVSLEAQKVTDKES
jgi:5-dehydro-2-deoxygluconokinase